MSLAAAAAAGGEPTPLLAVDANERTADGPVVGRLLSLNVGVPRDVEWEGKTIRTAIWKDPVDGPRMVRKVNIDGDDQADRAAHGGEHRAVFVYQIESYRYWEGELQRDDFSYGQFGENFTVEGLADDRVCIGDRYGIGHAIFEVTQPRVTCFRVGIRMREPRMPSLLVAHHRPGFYLRVLQEGLVQAGDEIRRLRSGPEQVSVADIDGLLYLPQRSQHTLQRALRIPALSDGWKESFRSLLEQAEAGSSEPAATAWTGFQPLKVTEVRRESSTIVSFRLLPANGEAIQPAPAGQYLTLRLRLGGGGDAPLIRSYSLSAIAGSDGYRISVKLEPGGAASKFLHEHVREGDLIDAAAPRGSFLLRADERPVALVSAGVGATPLLAMLEALALEHSDREIWWLHGARSGQEHAFGQEVDEAIGSLSHAHRIVAYSRPAAGELPGDTFDTTGRIDDALIQGSGIPVDADYYICGPEAFMRGLSAALTARGVPPDQVAMETFGAVTDVIAPGTKQGERRAPHQPEGPAGQGPAITFTRSNLTVPWQEDYPNLLEFVEACDVPVSFSCRTGVCHYCETGILTGEVTYITEPLEPPEEGRVLLCCSRPTSELALDL
jgi:ferredoxin-NADP reductase/MOSC domain-containing protein YiiM